MSSPVVGIPTPPTPGRSRSRRGGRRDPRGVEFRQVPFEGGLELVPDLVGHLRGAPSRCRRVVAAVVIIVVVDETPVSTSSLRVGRPMTRGPVDVDVAAGAAAAELFYFRSVPPPRGWRRGHRQEWSLLLPLPRLGGKSRQRLRRRRSHHLEETTTTKVVASFQGDEGEDEERTASFKG